MVSAAGGRGPADDLAAAVHPVGFARAQVGNDVGRSRTRRHRHNGQRNYQSSDRYHHPKQPPTPTAAMHTTEKHTFRNSSYVLLHGQAPLLVGRPGWTAFISPYRSR